MKCATPHNKSDPRREEREIYANKRAEQQEDLRKIQENREEAGGKGAEAADSAPFQAWAPLLIYCGIGGIREIS